VKIFAACLLAVIAFLLGFFFTAQNSQVVPLELYFIQIEWSLAKYIAISILIGFLLAATVSSFIILPLRWKIKRLTNKYDIQSQEVENLRSLPVKDQY